MNRKLNARNETNMETEVPKQVSGHCGVFLMPHFRFAILQIEWMKLKTELKNSGLKMHYLRKTMLNT